MIYISFVAITLPSQIWLRPQFSTTPSTSSWDLNRVLEGRTKSSALHESFGLWWEEESSKGEYESKKLKVFRFVFHLNTVGTVIIGRLFWTNITGAKVVWTIATTEGSRGHQKQEKYLSLFAKASSAGLYESVEVKRRHIYVSRGTSGWEWLIRCLSMTNSNLYVHLYF